MPNIIHHLKTQFLDIRFARFLAFGMVTATVNLVIGGFLYSNNLAEKILPYWAAVTIAGVLAMITGFFLNYFLNFRFRERSAISQFRTYVVIASSCIVITTVVSKLGLTLTEVLFSGEGFEFLDVFISFEFASHFCAVGSVAIYSYLAHKYFTFNVGFRDRVSTVIQRRKSNEN